MEHLYSAQILQWTLVMRHVHTFQTHGLPSSGRPFWEAFARTDFDAPGGKAGGHSAEPKGAGVRLYITEHAR
jgi:hypothetical protein